MHRDQEGCSLRSAQILHFLVPFFTWERGRSSHSCFHEDVIVIRLIIVLLVIVRSGSWGLQYVVMHRQNRPGRVSGVENVLPHHLALHFWCGDIALGMQRILSCLLI